MDAIMPAFISFSVMLKLCSGKSKEGEMNSRWSFMLGEEGVLLTRSDITGDDDIDKWELRSSKTSLILFVAVFTKIGEINIYTLLKERLIYHLKKIGMNDDSYISKLF